jgi:hypothetical protein
MYLHLHVLYPSHGLVLTHVRALVRSQALEFNDELHDRIKSLEKRCLDFEDLKMDLEHKVGSALHCTALLCLILLCLALPCLALPCLALPCLALHCPPLPCSTLPSHSMHCAALPCPALPCPPLPCSTLPSYSMHCTALISALTPFNPTIETNFKHDVLWCDTMCGV